MNKHQRIFLLFSALFGSVSISLAAIGAHALHNVLAINNHVETFSKAVDYSMYGALALLGITSLHKTFNNKILVVNGYLLVIGTTIFSGSLFLYTITNIKIFSHSTPIGGMILITAWLSIIISAVFSKRNYYR